MCLPGRGRVFKQGVFALLLGKGFIPEELTGTTSNESFSDFSDNGKVSQG